MNEIEKIGDDLTGRMPDVQSHVIDTESKPQEKSPATDKHGRTFDASLHETDASGAAVLNADGAFRARRGPKVGRKQSRAVDASQIPDNPGRAIAESIFAIGVLIGGEDFVPIEDAARGVNERATMTAAWEGYCQQKDIKDFPPGIALAMAMMGYVVPRFYMEKTKSRFSRAKDWLGAKYLNWKEKRAA